MDAYRAFGTNRLLTQNYETVRAGIGQWSKEDGIYKCEDRRICANAESEGQYRDRTKSRTLQKSAQCIFRIPEEAVEKRHAADVAALLFLLLDAAHLTQGCAASVLGWHPGSDVILDKVIPVISQLLVELLFYSVASDQRTNAQTKLPGPAHGRRLLRLAS
jgi:hypothetical protein